MKKSNGLIKKREDKTIEIIALLIAVLCLAMGFLSYTSKITIEQNLTANPNDLTFKVVFSTSNKSEKIEPVVPKIEPRSSSATAENAIIDNKNGPVITNLNVKFTYPGQRARYTFYVYNAGEYMAYLNDIIYSYVPYTNLKKVCLPKDGKMNESIKNACNDIKITTKITDITTSDSLYYINNRTLRPRTGQMVEVTIEYLKDGDVANKEFEVIFGDIYLSYAMFPGNRKEA